ncbi:MAG: hypothetical protein RBR59_02385 [Sulfurimonadaceae bacterium]|jgi:hypothetical protein|nr:hypothetical protein [Sulfurimonadaceae bacterium]
MELETSTWMLIFFLGLLTVSIWKIYAFLPNKPLADDDTTEESTALLDSIMLDTIARHGGNLLSSEQLFELMHEHEKFNKELFWRFNLNRLHQLLRHYYAKNPTTTSIEDIYKTLH